MITPIGCYYEIKFLEMPLKTKGSLFLAESSDALKIRMASIVQCPLNIREVVNIDLRICDIVYVWQPGVIEIEGRYFVNATQIIAEFEEK